VLHGIVASGTLCVPLNVQVGSVFTAHGEHQGLLSPTPHAIVVLPTFWNKAIGIKKENKEYSLPILS